MAQFPTAAFQNAFAQKRQNEQQSGNKVNWGQLMGGMANMAGTTYAGSKQRKQQQKEKLAEKIFSSYNLQKKVGDKYEGVSPEEMQQYMDMYINGTIGTQKNKDGDYELSGKKGNPTGLVLRPKVNAMDKYYNAMAIQQDRANKKANEMDKKADLDVKTYKKKKKIDKEYEGDSKEVKEGINKLKAVASRGLVLKGTASKPISVPIYSREAFLDYANEIGLEDTHPDIQELAMTFPTREEVSANIDRFRPKAKVPLFGKELPFTTDIGKINESNIPEAKKKYLKEYRSKLKKSPTSKPVTKPATQGNTAMPAKPGGKKDASTRYDQLIAEGKRKNKRTK